MTRRVILSTIVLATLTGFAGPAFASVVDSSSDGRHEVCVMGSGNPNGPTEGFCVWVPTN